MKPPCNPHETNNSRKVLIADLTDIYSPRFIVLFIAISRIGFERRPTFTQYSPLNVFTLKPSSPLRKR
ncbi:uncharacterized protein BT62DRAFT_933652 [Guyanagaster necrorhizus]|uniref:Uncharacterized protein n=1 Tax=Guyanagaster necrorhizus TaxID=856835 RepID=A0A9P7VPS0_9AGAR|nr:uncharacterized protein BT62DRAFT_933652 [Guyanagaster necrorhizus MCA 3950]KAG7444624.1 hypothetical protein BT62DRAFT_933652 [Guyanagaster necrorhizus MCA 3950]